MTERTYEHLSGTAVVQHPNLNILANPSHHHVEEELNDEEILDENGGKLLVKSKMSNNSSSSNNNNNIGRKRSAVWEHFLPNGKRKCSCKYCGHVFSSDPQRMGKHLSDHCTAIPQEIKLKETKKKRQSTVVSERKKVLLFRDKCRRNVHSGPTAGIMPGYAQANVIILPSSHAYDFLLFCHRNAKSCPLLDVTDPGIVEPSITAKDADIRTDVPKYRVFRYGTLESEVTDIKDLWQPDMVAFLLGCSYSFEETLVNAGLSIRHLEERNKDGSAKSVPMFETNIDCVPSGVFKGKLVVSMRPFKAADAIKASNITSRYPKVHGSPVHIGNPSVIGIQDLDYPQWGNRVNIYPDEIPVFWACGVTAIVALKASKPPLAITHSPGHMFITDVLNEDLACC